MKTNKQIVNFNTLDFINNRTYVSVSYFKRENNPHYDLCIFEVFGSVTPDGLYGIEKHLTSNNKNNREIIPELLINGSGEYLLECKFNEEERCGDHDEFISCLAYWEFEVVDFRGFE